MLAPTHEEEVTTLVAETVKSYKELPIKLYQNSRSSLLRLFGVVTDFQQLASTEMRFAPVMDCFVVENLLWWTYTHSI